MLGILRRRRWPILIAATLTSLGTLVVLSRIPSRYVSEATLLVMQQQVPQRYVVPTTTTDIREALQATTQEVLSRARLLQIIDEFGLYAKERKRLSPEGLLELMRHDIQIQPIESQSPQKEVNSFKISFKASSPRLAQEVTSRLTSLFIEQNLATREYQATTTTNFLRDQRDVARGKLAEAEEQVRSFKMQNLGELPEQQQSNLMILNGLQTQLQNTISNLSRAQEQRQYLQSLVTFRALSVEGDLNRLKSERATLLIRFTAKHPGVIKLDEKIAQTEALLATLREPSAPTNVQAITKPLSAASNGNDPDISIGQLKSQLEANRLEIENLSKDEAKLKASIDQYQTRLNQTPVREQQLAGILRNYDQLKQDYADLLNKEMQSQLAADLEKRQQGQQFRVVDQPSLPTIPSSPDRIKISLGGVGGGIALGLGIAILMEFKQQTFHFEKELSRSFSVPLVFGIPELPTPQEQRAATWTRRFEWLAASLLGMVVFAAELYEYYLYRHG